MPTIFPDGDYWLVTVNGRAIQCETYSAALELVREYTDE